MFCGNFVLVQADAVHAEQGLLAHFSAQGPGGLFVVPGLQLTGGCAVISTR